VGLVGAGGSWTGEAGFSGVASGGLLGAGGDLGATTGALGAGALLVDARGIFLGGSGLSGWFKGLAKGL